MLNKLAIIVIYIFVLAIPCYSQYNLNTMLFNAKLDISNKKYIDAINKLNVCINFNSVNYEAYFYRGISKYYLNDYLGAKQDLNNVLNNFPNLLEETYHYLAFVKYNLGDFNDAIIDLNHVIEKQSKNAQLYIERAYFKLDKHDYKDAIEDCNKAINFNCLNENAYLCIGIAENEGKNFENALLNFKKAIEINPQNENIFVRKGITLALMGKYTESILDFNKALEINEGSLFAYYNRAEIWIKLNMPDSAIKDYNTILKYEPINSIVYFNKGVIEANKKDYHNALNSFDKVLLLNPENIQALYNRARIKQIKNDFKGALSDYNQAIRLFPYFTEAYYNRSIVKIKLNDYHGAKNDNILYNMFSNIDITRDSLQQVQDSTILSRFLKLDANFHSVDIKYQDTVSIGMMPLFRIAIDQTDDVKYYQQTSDSHCLNKSNLAIINMTPQKKYDFLLTDSLYALSEKSKFSNAIKKTDMQLYNDAEKDYNDIISKNPECASAYFARGINTFLEAELLDLFTEDKITTINTTSSNIVQQIHDKYLDAINDFEIATHLDSSLSYAFFNIAFVKYKLQYLEDALDSYSRAILINKNLTEAYFNRGLILLQLNNKLEACKDFSIAGEFGLPESYIIIKKFCQQISE
ncbi:MAG: hypothetical protein A2W98_14320 [Bacteroidetes bacterium GWF2_33_38]|nr:MAG: hypothetical protein A2W98_14320 [Bacteroidetes bacterium GWF2_33_38]OFY74905.1 MAG: hypothetical protein A2265_10260 [Bacteroidetes bacterium RIFOXYA12_FULL_33_9]OFY90446.1 MAG: hypothetical protein A2236_11030 [Bacteroidetes bacterium RIFOXYA2_FULL_33_7]